MGKVFVEVTSSSPKSKEPNGNHHIMRNIKPFAVERVIRRSHVELCVAASRSLSLSLALAMSVYHTENGVKVCYIVIGPLHCNEQKTTWLCIHLTFVSHRNAIPKRSLMFYTDECASVSESVCRAAGSEFPLSDSVKSSNYPISLLIRD